MIKTLSNTSFLSLGDELVTSDQCVKFDRGVNLISEGDETQSFYVIKSGVLKIELSENGNSLILGYLVSGDVIGLLGLYEKVDYPYSIKTLTDSEIFIWEQTKVAELIQLIPEIGNKIKRSYSEWSLCIFDRLRSLVFMTKEERIVSWIIEACNNKKYVGANLWGILNYSDMASFCNVEPEEFMHCLKTLSKKGAVEFTEDYCKVVSWEALKQLSGKG